MKTHVGLGAKLIAVLVLALPAAAEPVRIAGTGASTGAMELLIAEYTKGRSGARFLPVEAIGSGGAIKAALAGALDIAVVSRPLADADRAAGASAVEYARTPFVIAVATKLPVRALSRAQLAGAYDGTLERWPDGTWVRPVLRPADDIDIRYLKALSPQIAAAVDSALKRPGMLVASTDREAADLIEKTPGSIGTSTLGLIRSEARSLQPLAIDGVQPTIEALEAGSYPHHKRLYMVTGKKTPSPEAKRFMEFVGSAPGKALLARTGHLVPPFKAP